MGWPGRKWGRRRSRPGLGLNTDFLVRYGGDFPSKNLMWQCDVWSVTDVSLDQFVSGCPLSSIPLDSDGYPNELPLTVGGYGEQQVVFTSCIGSNVTGPYFYKAGTYTVYWDGAGTIRIRGDSGNVTSSTSGFTFTIATPGTGGIGVVLLASTSGNRLRNLRVIVPGETAASFAANPWNADYGALIEPFGTLRFMNWLATNEPRADNTLTTAASRVLPTYFTQNSVGRGMAYEHIVDLCTRVDINPWVNIFHAAEDDYILALANAMFSLPTNRTIRAEAGNEVWNGVFANQHNFLADLGIARGFNLVGPGTLGSAADASVRYGCALKAQAWLQAKTHKMFADVFGPTSTRVKRGIGAFIANYSTTRVTVASYYHADINPYMTGGLPTYPLEEFYVAPYWGSAAVTALQADPTISISAFMDAIVAQAYSEPMTWFAGNQSVANDYGLKIVCYEHGFGAAIVDTATPDANEAPARAKILEARNHPRMQDAYGEFFRACDNSGVTPVGCALGFIFPTQNSGAWGALENQYQPPTTPTWLAFLARLAVERARVA